MNQHKVTLSPTPADDPSFDDGLYDVFKHDIHLPWSDARVIWGVLNGSQGPVREQAIGFDKPPLISYGPTGANI